MNEQSEKKFMNTLGMLFFLFLALWLILDLASGLKDMNSGNQIIYGMFFGAGALSAGTAAFMYGYKLFMPAERHGWIKKKPAIAAILSVALFLFVGISFPAAHQYALRGKDSEAQSSLHYMYVACKSYWKKQGGDKVCDLKTISQKEYGFVRNQYVTIDGRGTAKTFIATARHQTRDNVFTIDAQGEITRVKSQRP